MTAVRKVQSDVQQVKKALVDMATRPASKARVGPGVVFGGQGNTPFAQHGIEEWPVAKLKALEGAYRSPVAVDLYCRRKSGGYKISGMGPALVRLAALSGNPDARSVAIANGMPGDYNNDKLEEEFGFTTVAKAHNRGVAGPRWGLGQGQVRKVALAEGSGQSGGYIVPPQFMNELLTIAAEDGFIEQRAKVVPMNSRTVDWPMLDITTAQASGTSPYFGGIVAQWQPEAQTINETEPAFRQSTWTAWDLVLYTVSSNQLLADNGIGLDALLTQLFGQAITWYKEYAYLQGKGAGSTMPLGIINAPATILQKRNTAGRFLLTDAAAMMSHLQVRSMEDACWIMHQSLIPQLIQMVDGGYAAGAASGSFPAGNRLVWMNPMGDPGKSNQGPMAMKMPNLFLNGLPLYFTEKLPSIGTTGDVMLVDWSRYVIGTRLDFQVDVSPHYLFRNNQLAWRVVSRSDGKPWMNSAITDASGWSLSPFVVLQ